MSDVYVHSDTHEPYVAVTRPIVLRDGSKALLTISTPTLALNRVLAPSVPAGWVVGVGDRSGVYVTRSARHEEVSGKPGVAAYLSKAVGRSGSFTSANQFGENLLAGYHRSEFSDWLFAANISLATVEAPLWRSLFGVLGIGAVALAISLSTGLRYGQDVHAVRRRSSRLKRLLLARGTRCSRLRPGSRNSN